MEAKTAAFWLRMNAPLTTNTTQTKPPPPLWRVAEAFMHVLHALFGDPSQVAFKHTLTLKAHRLMASWLRCGEAMMRHLLLIEAQAFAKPNIRPLLRAARKRVRKLRSFFPETPEKWRVSFRCFPTPTRALSPSKGGGCDPALRQAQGSAPRPFIFREGCLPPPTRGLSLSKAAARRTRRQRHKPTLRQDREWVRRQEPSAFRSAWPLAERYEALLRAYANRQEVARRLSRRLHATPHRAHELLHAPPEARERIEGYCELALAAEASAAVFNTS